MGGQVFSKNYSSNNSKSQNMVRKDPFLKTQLITINKEDSMFFYKKLQYKGTW